MKITLTLLLFNLSYVFASIIPEKRRGKRYINCVNPSWTFLYKGFQFKDIIDSYESEPTFLVSLNDILSKDFKMKKDSTDKTKMSLVLNLEVRDIKNLLTGPFITAPINPRKIVRLVEKIIEKTGASLEFVIIPGNTPIKVIEALYSANISVIKPSSTINHATDLNSFSLRNFVVVDLSENGLDWIVKMGKFLDDTETSLFSLKECLNITPPGREQTKTVESLNSKLLTVRNSAPAPDYRSGWIIRRDHALDESLTLWRALNPPNIFKNAFSIVFEGEPGIDAGGLTQEWITLITKEGFGSESKYFDTSDAYYVVPKSNVAALDYYRFLGSFVAKVILNGNLAQCKFPNFLLKMMMGKNPNFHDLKQFDPELFENFKKMSTDDLESGSYGVFSYSKVDENGANLKENGSDIDIDEENENKYEFMWLRFKAIVNTPQIKAFVEGFRNLITFYSMPVNIFKADELRFFIMGASTIDVADWKINTEYSGYNSGSSQIVWFWEVVESLDENKRRQLLRWATGSDSVPIEGFAALKKGMFTINRKRMDYYRDELNLPQAHTCFNSIDLPEYASKQVLSQRLLAAIEQEGFGFG